MQNQGLEYAGFWLRTGANIIDTIIVMCITYPLLILIYGWAYLDVGQTGIVAGPADVLISYITPTIVVILFWIYKQATPGKMAVSIKIVDAVTGQPASFGQLVGRYFAYILSRLPLFLGFIAVAFDSRKQGWHDKLAGTVVVKTNPKNSNDF